MSTQDLRESGARKSRANCLRWIARLWGALVAIFWVSSLVTSTIGEISTGAFRWESEGAILGLLVAVCALGVLIAWRREYAGGLILLAGGSGLGVFAFITAGHNKLFAVAVSGFPFFLAGALFLSSRRAARQS